jgi:hypothetical protein
MHKLRHGGRGVLPRPTQKNANGEANRKSGSDLARRLAGWLRRDDLAGLGRFSGREVGLFPWGQGGGNWTENSGIYGKHGICGKCREPSNHAGIRLNG